MDAVFEALLRELPPAVARSEAPRLTGYMVASGSLANHDSLGTGPTGLFYLGRKAFYPRESLVQWLRERASTKPSAKVRLKGKAA